MITEFEPLIIECDCENHLLKVSCEMEVLTDDNKVTRIRREYKLSMFYYGIDGHKPRFWKRLFVAFKYLVHGRMHSDQMILQDEGIIKLHLYHLKCLSEAIKLRGNKQ